MALLTLQPSSATSADTYIGDSFADTNSEGSGILHIGERNTAATITRTLLKFDLTDLPSNIAISSAILTLTTKQDLSDNTRTFRVYRLKKTFVADEVTWNIYSTGNSWTAAGGFNSADCEQTDIGSASLSATEGTEVAKEFSLTPTTKAGLDLGNGWLIKADTETDDAWGFYASDEATEAYRPELEVTYTILPSGNALFFSGGGLGVA